jgi:hypothetical protein
LQNLRHMRLIRPFRRAFVPEGYSLIGFVATLDGGRPGFGTLIHSLAAIEKDVL